MSLEQHINWGNLQNYEQMPQPLIAKIEAVKNSHALPLHTHPKGQLIIALHGYVTCEIENALWMVPANNAIWIPPHIKHTNRASDQAKLGHLFIQNQLTGLPVSPCVLSLTTVTRELFIHFASLNQHYSKNGFEHKVAEVLFELLTQMPTQQLNFVQSKHTVVKQIASTLLKQPDNRTTLTQWANHFALGERTLARLIKHETGMTFGQWRSQLHLIIALQKLEEQQSVQAVSDSLGYESVSAFITMFKKALGKSPKRYIAELN
ncbi:helix-turn-helix transcriptional regulator [Catenovulum sp. 2E275]|uniref:AraC family transcriptional regulator n=1 Tax=Catenovulum sp. 2E275 TaxID=2980497 RepID=UPI0021D348BC|nr:helix-turn-helix transcriptional regulator [Catenovulum sp. 2E275]MCU4677648.1 helix-turn-helix transcriptional regulator [Catenovulum sp. 2E275]